VDIKRYQMTTTPTMRSYSWNKQCPYLNHSCKSITKRNEEWRRWL